VANAGCRCLTYCISVAVDASLSVAIDMDALSGDYKPRMMILESNWVGVVSPVIEVIGQLRHRSCVSVTIPDIRYEK
jgi:hypothetical protein